MKLIFCPDCHDIVRLLLVRRECVCGKSWGKYVNFLDAEIGGNAIPIGFSNESFMEAVNNRPENGLGEIFTSFIIPRQCDTVKYSLE